MKRLIPLVAVVAILMAPSVALGQTGPAMEIVDVNTERYDLNGSTTMVVEFRNLDGALDPGQLVVTANGEPVELLGVDPLGQTQEPVGIVLVIDVSGSMEGEPIEAAKAAASSFVSQKRPGDFIALVTFGDGVQTVSGFTTDVAALNARIAELEAAGETAFNDGVIEGIGLFEQSNATALRRNIIVLTDGADTVSIRTTEDVLAAIDNPANPVRVFGVALESPEFQPAAVQQIADAGEGLFLSTSDPAELAPLYDQIQREIGNLLIVRLGSPVFEGGPVEFAVNYAGLTDVETIAVPGFVTTTSIGSTTTVTFAAAAPFVVRSNLPVPAGSLLFLAALGMGAAIGLFIYILFGRGGEEAGAVFRRRLEAYGRRGAAEEKRSIFDRIPFLRMFSQKAEEAVEKRGLLSGVNSALEQANIPVSAGEAVAAGFGLSAVAGVLFALFTGNPIMGLVAFVIGVMLVLFVLKFLGGREKRKFENQLPDTLTLISTSLRAGYSLLQAVEAVAAESPNPTAREFGRAIVEARLGRQVVAALQGITARTQSQDFEWAVMAIEIQREVGGNLAEVLQTVSETMRQRNRLKGEIRALTAEGRISAYVLGALPFAMGGFLFAANPEYIGTLFETTMGIVAIIAGCVLMAGGGLWLRKIVNIEV